MVPRDLALVEDLDCGLDPVLGESARDGVEASLLLPNHLRILPRSPSRDGHC